MRWMTGAIAALCLSGPASAMTLILAVVIGVIAGVIWERSRAEPVRTGNPPAPVERPDGRGSPAGAVPPPAADSGR